MKNKEITAVAWIVEQLRMQTPLYTKEEIISIAKEMEKEQIIDAYRKGFISDDIKLAEDYYNDKFKSE